MPAHSDTALRAVEKRLLFPAGHTQHVEQIALQQRVDRKIHINHLSEQLPDAIVQINKLESDKVFLMVGNKRSCTAKARLTSIKYFQTTHMPSGFAKVAIGHEQRTFQGDIQKRAFIDLSGKTQRTLGMKRKARKTAAF